MKIGMISGFILGFIIASINMWGELLKRISWANGGGRGETAQWGEPLFYIILIGIPCGIIGAFIGGIIFYFLGFIRK